MSISQIIRVMLLVVLGGATLTAQAAGPGKGTLSKTVSSLANCQASKVTVSWNLSSLMGEPMVKGNFKWTGDGECKLPSSTVVWLKLAIANSMSGFVKLPLDEVPKANQGFGRDMARSPNWNSTVCSYSGVEAKNCLPKEQAVKLWKEGRVVDFVLQWDPADVRSTSRSNGGSKSSSGPVAIGSGGVNYKIHTPAPRRTTSSSKSTQSTSSVTPKSSTTASNDPNYDIAGQQMRNQQRIREQQRRQLALMEQQRIAEDRARQQQINQNAEQMADVMMAVGEMDLPEPVAWAGTSWLLGLTTLAMMPNGDDVAGQDEFDYDLLFSSTAVALTGATAYLRFADLGDVKRKNVQLLRSSFSLADREQFVVFSKEDELDGFTLSTAKYYGSEYDKSGFAVWTDYSSHKSDETISYAVENDGDNKLYTTDKHVAFSAGLGGWVEARNGLLWGFGAMPFSLNIMDDHAFTRMGPLFPELGGRNSDESMSILDALGPLRVEVSKDKLTFSSLYDAQTGSMSLGLGYSWR